MNELREFLAILKVGAYAYMCLMFAIAVGLLLSARRSSRAASAQDSEPSRERLAA